MKQTGNLRNLNTGIWKEKSRMKERIYVCHTFYHIYVSFLKEFALPKEKQGHATLVISHMSTVFGDLPERIRKLGFFEEVVDFDEKRDDYFPELAKYKVPQKNFVKALLNRHKYTKLYARLEAEFIPVDFKNYKEIYVFCDSDPIGYYLNQNKIYYHAVEDGLNCLWFFDTARYDNRGHFGIKAFMSKKLNLIFIQNGYGKYCIDMEVNDISKIKNPFSGYVEVPRDNLVKRLTSDEKNLLLRAFVRNIDELVQAIKYSAGGAVLVLTEPLCTLDVREQIFKDIIAKYGKDKKVILKPHPRDELNYETLFPGFVIIDKTVPMEMLNFFDDCKVDLAISVLTNTEGIKFAKEVLMLGPDFLDAYEAPEIHRQNEKI